MPVTLMGFSLQGFSPSWSFPFLSDWNPFLTFPTGSWNPGLASIPVPCTSRLQGFALQGRFATCKRRLFIAPAKPLPSWASHLLRKSPLKRPVACATAPLLSFATTPTLPDLGLRPKTATGPTGRGDGCSPGYSSFQGQLFSFESAALSRLHAPRLKPASETFRHIWLMDLPRSSETVASS